MARQKLIPRVLEDRLYEWAIWEERVFDQSSLGYPNRTMEGRMARGDVGGGGGRPKSRVPNLEVPRHLKAIDKAISGMPHDLRLAISSHYRNIDVPKHALTKSQHWLMGALSQSIIACEIESMSAR